MRYLGLGIAVALASIPAITEAQDKRVVYIKTLVGKTFEIPYDIRNTVLDVKRQIEKKHNVSPDTQWLIFAGKRLENDRLILDYQIKAGSTLHLVLRLKE